jgi:hypothetical protein
MVTNNWRGLAPPVMSWMVPAGTTSEPYWRRGESGAVSL